MFPDFDSREVDTGEARTFAAPAMDPACSCCMAFPNPM